MSNFQCEKCGTVCYDTPSGYVTGCEHYPVDIESDIKVVWEGQFVKVALVDTTTECTVKNNVYSLTEMMDLQQELVEAFQVTAKELGITNHV